MIVHTKPSSGPVFKSKESSVSICSAQEARDVTTSRSPHVQGFP